MIVLRSECMRDTAGQLAVRQGEADLLAQAEHDKDAAPLLVTTSRAFAEAVQAEVGRQLTETATENARDVVRAFLQLTDALPGDPPSSPEPDYYTMVEAVEKPSAETYDLLVENFERCEAGTTYARAGGDELVADEPFVPILMSETGYDDIFGYRGRVAGESLEEARETWLDGSVAAAD